MNFFLKNCPICDAKMFFSHPEHDLAIVKCGNGCFYASNKYDGRDTIAIFEEKWAIDNVYDDNDRREFIHRDILKRIDYWREDDKYLLKILSGSYKNK